MIFTISFANYQMDYRILEQGEGDRVGLGGAIPIWRLEMRDFGDGELECTCFVLDVRKMW